MQPHGKQHEPTEDDELDRDVWAVMGHDAERTDDERWRDVLAQGSADWSERASRAPRDA